MGWPAGKVANLGGFGDNLAPLGVQLAPGVTLNRLGFGLCLSPPPLQVRGDIGAELFNGKLVVNGRFLYSDGTDVRPWFVEVGGNATLGGTYLGDGSMRFNASGNVDFGLSTDLDLDVVSLNGKLKGWVEPQRNVFNVQGSLQGCITGLPCARADGLISSTGVAGCLDAGVIELPEPYNARQGPFGFGSISFSVRTYTIQLKAGFGHRFDTPGVDLLGNSCDFSPYSATRSVLTSTGAPGSEGGLAARAAISERIARGTKAVTFRVHGSDGPPKVVVRGPDGTTITSPRGRKSAKQRKNRYLLAENPTDGTTSVLLVNPAPGKWTIGAAPGGDSSPTTVDRSDFEAPPTLFGQMRRSGQGPGARPGLLSAGRVLGAAWSSGARTSPARSCDPSRVSRVAVRPPFPAVDELLCSRVKIPALARSGRHPPESKQW